MMEVEQLYQPQSLSTATILTTILAEFSAVTDYRTLRDNLPRRLAPLLKCRSILLYQRIGETLQFASGTFDDVPGWSASLLSVAHINPIDLSSDLPEARAWRERHATTLPINGISPTLVAAPLIYRQRAIGVLVALRNNASAQFIASQATQPMASQTKRGAERQYHKPTISPGEAYWSREDVEIVEAVAVFVALLLENTRLLERDRERISELSLLNRIASQLNCSMYEFEQVQNIAIQRSREITSADLCAFIRPGTAADAPSWMAPSLSELLLSHFNGTRGPHLHPLIIERPGDVQSAQYLSQLPANVKTFFAIPLLVSESTLYRYGPGASKFGASLVGSAQEIGEQNAVGGISAREASMHEHIDAHNSKVHGIIVGAYHRTWKLRHEELALLQVLASQVSAVLEHMHLMLEVVEARNEARKLMRQVLEDQRLKELILENMPGGLITADLAGRITTYNRAAAAVLGYHPYEVLGQPLQNILHLSMPVEGQATASNNQADSLSGPPPVSQTLVTLDRNGQEIALDAHVVPLHNDQQQQIGTLATFTDVTSMHRLEEEKRRLDRLASLGEMAAGVAHEVRNPLASIKTSIQMLMVDLAEATVDRALKEDAHDCLQRDMQESASVVLKEVERLDAIVRDLLLFAKPRQLHAVACDLVALSEHVLQIMQGQCVEAGIEIHRVYHDVPMIQVDVAQMEQVLLNLYLNALQAMPDGGILTISCQIVSSRSGFVNAKREKATPLTFGVPIGVHNAQEQWLELSVGDVGVGIAPDQLERIFQPFFTTKAHGIGLGLPITRRLIEDHRGQILVDSQFGYGTTISIRLPLANVEVSVASTGTSMVPVVGAQS